MVPAASDGIPPVPPYSGSRFASFPFRLQASHLLRGAFPGASARFRIATLAALLPRRGLDPHGLGSSAFARHYSRNHSCSLLLPLLRCFSSRRSPRLPAVPGLQPGGFPHSDTRGSSAICASPRLFAACRVLPRLREPQASPVRPSRFPLPLAPASRPGRLVFSVSLAVNELSRHGRDPAAHASER